MEDKTKVALSVIGSLFGLQVIAWYFGVDGAVTQLVGSAFGLIVGYYFGKKTEIKTA